MDEAKYFMKSGLFTVSILKGDKPKQYPKEEILDDQDRLAKGWISIESKDLDNEIIPVSELKKTLNIWMDRGAPMTDQHTNRVVGKGLRWYEKKHSTGNMGIMLEYKIFKNYSTDNEVWKDIKSGKRRGLSFGGRATKEPTFQEGGSTGPAKELHGVESMEIATVEQPAHPLALNTEINYLAKAAKEEINPDESATDLKGDDLIALEIYGRSYNDLTDVEKEQCKLRKKLANAVIALVKGMIKKPFADYEDFDECLSKNSDKKDPAAYCASIMRQVEGKKKTKEETGEGEKPDEEKIIKKFLINRIDKKLDGLAKSLKDYKIKNIDKKLSGLIYKLKEPQIRKIEKNLDLMLKILEK